MIYMGIDPGFTGAWGMIDHHGKYVSCGDMINDTKMIRSRLVFAEMSQARDMQDIDIVVEAVHSMPKQGVASSFKFGMAYGAALALAERFNCPWETVTPQKWKKDMKLSSNKNDSLEMARNLWPNAPLHLKKHDGRAEALLMAQWLRTQTI